MIGGNAVQLGVEDHPSGPGATGQEKQAGGDEGARGGRGDLDRAPRRTDAHDPGEELPDVVADEQGHPRVYIPASMSSIAARSSSEGWTNRGDGHVGSLGSSARSSPTCRHAPP